MTTPRMPVFEREVVDSTMLEAGRLVESGEPVPFAVRAAEQTGGRGRLGRSWSSPPGGVWMTAAWPAGGGAEVSTLPPRVGLAVCAAIEAVTSIRDCSLRIKWPNDVLVEGKKVAGVLCELSGAVVLIGMGINADFEPGVLPEDLRVPATTVRAATGEAVDARRLGLELLGRLERVLSPAAMSDNVVVSYHARLAYLGEQVRIESAGTPIEGVLIGVDANASLILRTATGERVVRSGEIVRLRHTSAEAMPVPLYARRPSLYSQQSLSSGE